MKKKILIGILGIILAMFINITTVHAISGSINSRASYTNVTLGYSTTVTVTVSSSSPIGAWEFVLNYDKSKLSLTSSTPTYVVDYGNGVKTSASYTYTFKTIATGTANVSVKDASVIDFNSEQEISLSISGVNINISKPVVVVKSSDATLSALTISEGTLDPKFSSSTTEYNVELNEIVDNITLSATKNNSKANVIGDGEFELTEGLNVFDIKVTAENGATKTYKVNVNMIDENPVEVLIGDNNYTIVKKANIIDAPNNYVNKVITIKGAEVPAYENININMLLVALKDEEGEVKLYTYNESTEQYNEYNEFATGIVNLFITNPTTDNAPLGYTKTNIIINGIEVEGWESVDTDLKLVYALNVNTGDYEYYSYDTVEQTFQRYLSSAKVEEERNNNLFYILLVVVGSLLVTALILYIPLTLKFKKELKKKKSV